ncbi:MAG: hypothetical protein H6914_00010 [Novosphingobium sp.]|nr:hypothetical protein [Novosphingobium sp.]
MLSTIDLTSVPKVYRHFAVVTLVVTLLMAMFADGENREAMADEIRSRERAAETKSVSAAKYGTAKLIKSTGLERKGGGFGKDSGEFGAPMDTVGSQVEYNPEVFKGGAAPKFVPGAYRQFGISKAEWDSLSDEDRAKLIAEMHGGGLSTDPEIRKAQLDKLIAASARRSGSIVE